MCQRECVCVRERGREGERERGKEISNLTNECPGFSHTWVLALPSPFWGPGLRDQGSGGSGFRSIRASTLQGRMLKGEGACSFPMSDSAVHGAVQYLTAPLVAHSPTHSLTHSLTLSHSFTHSLCLTTPQLSTATYTGPAGSFPISSSSSSSLLLSA